MVTSPPPYSGNDEEVRFQRWVVENTLRGNGELSSIRDIAKRAARRADDNAINSGDIAVGLDVDDNKYSGTSTDRVPAPLSNKPFWERVTYGLEKSLNSLNVEATPMGLLMSPRDGEGAAVTLTAILPVPASRKFYVYAEGNNGFKIMVDWMNPDFTIMEGGTVEVGTSRMTAMTDATHYRFYAVRLADELPSLLLKANVFEIIGTGGPNSVETGPDSFQINDGNGNVVVDLTPDLPILPAPTTPTMSSALGQVLATWNGKLAPAVTPPANFSHVVVEYGPTNAGPWKRLAAPLSSAGPAIIQAGAVGSTAWARFIAIDRLGRESPASTAQSIVVEGIKIPDVDATINNAINKALADAAAAQMTADGKNRIFVRTEAPDSVIDAPLSGGDQWWVLAEDGSLVGIKMWSPVTNGGSWVDYRIVADEIIVPGSVGGTLITDGAVTTDKVAANAIDASKIQALAILAEHVTAGAIRVTHLAAGVGGALNISANKSITFLVGEVSSNASDIAAISTVYRLTPTGAEISKPDSPFALTIQNTGISITENGATVSYWNAGQMFVPSLVGEEVIAAHHKIEKYFDSAGNIAGTVVRSTY